MDKVKVIGYCRECWTELTAEHEDEEYLGVYHCPKKGCGYPNSEFDYFSEDTEVYIDKIEK